MTEVPADAVIELLTRRIAELEREKAILQVQVAQLTTTPKREDAATP